MTNQCQEIAKKCPLNPSNKKFQYKRGLANLIFSYQSTIRVQATDKQHAPFSDPYW